MTEWMPLEFASPFFLFGAAGVLLLFLFFSLTKRPTLLYSDFRLLGRRGGKILAAAVWALLLVCIFSFFGALAKPEIHEKVAIPLYSRDFVAVFDYSGSMELPFREGDGVETSKFDAGRDASFSFLAKRSEDRFAYVLFAGDAYSTPLLTGSRHILESRLLQEGLSERKSSPLKELGDRLTNIERGILAALAIFEKMSVADTRVMVLMSDLEGDIQKTSAALKEAKLRGVSRVYILVVPESPPIDYDDFDVYLPNYSFPDQLRAATKSFSEGFLILFDIRNENALQEAYQEIDRLETSRTGEDVIKSKRSIAGYFVASALASFFLLAVLSFSAWKKVF